MRNHCREERLGVSWRWAPCHNFLHRAVERMFGQVESELEKSPAFLQVAQSESRTCHYHTVNTGCVVWHT